MRHDDCKDGSVTQRFCLAILQKMSIKEEVVEKLHQVDFEHWLIKLLEKSTKKGKSIPSETTSAHENIYGGIHVFCLDFGSALLASIFHSHAVLD